MFALRQSVIVVDVRYVFRPNFNQSETAVEPAKETAQQAADQVNAGFVQTERMVREHPMKSLAVCFGVGLVTGAVTGLLLRTR